jgi:DNA polymerase (family X)
VTVPIKLGNFIPGTLAKNGEVAHHLLLISMGLTLDGENRFKVGAFEKAADSIMVHPTDIREIEDVKSISGVGESVAVVVREYLQTGTSRRYQELAKKHPVEALTMTVVDGVGPKGAMKLYESGIKNFDQLVEAARTGKLDKKLTDSVLFAVGKTRVPYEEAKTLAQAVIEALKGTPVLRFEVCGSIRRRAKDSKDVDIVGSVAKPEDRVSILNEFVNLGTIIKSGEDRAAIRFTHKGRTMQVDLWLVPPESWGAALNYATGSRDHNIKLRAEASKRGMLVNEFGIFEVATNRRIGGEDERDLYRLLETPYVEPHERG